MPDFSLGQRGGKKGEKEMGSSSFSRSRVSPTTKGGPFFPSPFSSFSSLYVKRRRRRRNKKERAFCVQRRLKKEWSPKQRRYNVGGRKRNSNKSTVGHNWVWNILTQPPPKKTTCTSLPPPPEKSNQCKTITHCVWKQGARGRGIKIAPLASAATVLGLVFPTLGVGKGSIFAQIPLSPRRIACSRLLHPRSVRPSAGRAVGVSSPLINTFGGREGRKGRTLFYKFSLPLDRERETGKRGGGGRRIARLFPAATTCKRGGGGRGGEGKGEWNGSRHRKRQTLGRRALAEHVPKIRFFHHTYM